MRVGSNGGSFENPYKFKTYRLMKKKKDDENNPNNRSNEKTGV